MFEDAIASLCVQGYGHDDGKAGVGLWRFFQIGGGDLVVALEGTTVRGVAEATSGAITGYWFDSRYHYAQCIGRDVRWVDWSYARMPQKPTAPAQSVLAAAQVQNDRDLVFAAWEQLSGD